MLKRDDIKTHKATGKKVRVISVESDPAVKVWVCFVDDPDRDMFVMRDELAD